MQGIVKGVTNNPYKVEVNLIEKSMILKNQISMRESQRVSRVNPNPAGLDNLKGAHVTSTGALGRDPQTQRSTNFKKIIQSDPNEM